MRTAKEILGLACTCGHTLIEHSVYGGDEATCLKRLADERFCPCMDFSLVDAALADVPCRASRDVQ